MRGFETVLRSYLSVGAASRAVNSKASFISETKYLVENMMRSFSKRLEIQCMYGQEGLGEIESVTGTVLKIEDHEWAAGIWAGQEGAKIEIFNNGLTVQRTGVAVITNVDFDTKEITIDALPTGTVATDRIFFKTALTAGPSYNEMMGLHRIISNNGVMFNINAGSYSLWKGNVIDVGTNFSGGEAVMSFAKLSKGVTKSMEKGLADMDVLFICAPASWDNLLQEQAAKRSYDQSYSNTKVEQGSKSIIFFSQNGKIEIRASIYCKAGYAYMIPVKQFSRIGSSDITMDQIGFEGKFFRLVENYNAYELRAYTDQSLYTDRPGWCTLFRYIKD